MQLKKEHEKLRKDVQILQNSEIAAKRVHVQQKKTELAQLAQLEAELATLQAKLQKEES